MEIEFHARGCQEIHLLFSLTIISFHIQSDVNSKKVNIKVWIPYLVWWWMKLKLILLLLLLLLCKNVNSFDFPVCIHWTAYHWWIRLIINKKNQNINISFNDSKLMFKCNFSLMLCLSILGRRKLLLWCLYHSWGKNYNMFHNFIG